MYIKKTEFIAGDDQVCSPHMNALPLAGASALGERHFCPKNLPIYLSIMPLAVCTKDQLFPDLPQMLC